MNATELSRALSSHAEAVCRHYLPNGRKNGRYWVCGNVQGAPGKSMHVRLAPPGTPGKWTDEATGEHGDLLDIIRSRIDASELRDAMVEGHRFLSLPVRPGAPLYAPPRTSQARNADSAHRIWRSCQDLAGTHAEAYLRTRGISVCDQPSLRYHPTLLRRDDLTVRRFPAMVASVLDNNGALQGIHRTWLDPNRPAKVGLPEPRKALGPIHTHGVRFGPPKPGGTLIAGEGIETVLSIVTVLPGVPAIATLAASHLGAFVPPPEIGLLLIARDNERDGIEASLRLRRSCKATGIAAIVIEPRLGDFNDDLQEIGPDAVAAAFTPYLTGS